MEKHAHFDKGKRVLQILLNTLPLIICILKRHSRQLPDKQEYTPQD